jgi:TatD DNase family protein
MSDFPFINLHFHGLSGKQEGKICLRSLMAGEAFDSESADFFTVGIHPWQLEKQEEDSLFQQLNLMLQQEKIIALGEAGLDRSIKTPHEKQIPVFRKQAEMAEQMKLPLIIHAVRSLPEIINLRKEINACQNWIIHGFAGNIFEAEQLINNGFSISFGNRLIHPKSKLFEVLTQIPIERIFFETDESEIPIETIYEFAASVLKISIKDLQKQVFANFVACFSKVKL